MLPLDHFTDERRERIGESDLFRISRADEPVVEA
jgi:hypothetical protein